MRLSNRRLRRVRLLSHRAIDDLEIAPGQIEHLVPVAHLASGSAASKCVPLAESPAPARHLVKAELSKQLQPLPEHPFRLTPPFSAISSAHKTDS
jgi:hypothetical protein